ncbi:MAG: ABC transporter ATP-binding protein [Alphaproteobacteria bacterium]|nr:MAG: ABC transporter ATP-binding protein [Alphaproteobacteria bacterium]
MFQWFERRVAVTAAPPAGAPPPTTLAFYWHFIRQMRGLYAAMFVTGLGVSAVDALIPVFIGQLVALAAAPDPATALAEAAPMLAAMAAVLLVVRPGVQILDALVRNSAVAPAGNSIVRWQSHWHVVRQSWSFFQGDFAGRIANRVMQVGHALRETVISAVRAVWHILVFGATGLAVLAVLEPWLMLPLLLWAAAYLSLLRWFVPRLHARARDSSLVRSLLMGRIVDSYTNILTVKLFARAQDEDRHVEETIHSHLVAMQQQNRVVVLFIAGLVTLNALLLTSMATVALSLWADGRIGVGTVATALPMCVQIAAMSGWVAMELASIFENIGVVQEGMETIAVPHSLTDQPGAPDLVVTGGAIQFQALRFGYGQSRPVIDGLTLDIRAGERIGLVGRSGAGKSTLVNLLLRFYEPEGGRILIDGQDIAMVSQESLRQAIAMVTQDTSLLHRSIAENIRYGKRSASDAEVAHAAAQAHADAFIRGLSDWRGRTGYDAHVGERGVKLSGGQRQRIAIARVILKNAPILVLDEATSALDSDVEAAIQDQLDGLMAGKTVIAIAHRLSTIARLDRLVVIDQGRVIEQGSHAALLAAGGVYADLWRRQSGGFLADH